MDDGPNTDNDIVAVLVKCLNVAIANNKDKRRLNTLEYVLKYCSDIEVKSNDTQNQSDWVRNQPNERGCFAIFFVNK